MSGRNENPRALPSASYRYHIVMANKAISPATNRAMLRSIALFVDGDHVSYQTCAALKSFLHSKSYNVTECKWYVMNHTKHIRKAVPIVPAPPPRPAAAKSLLAPVVSAVPAPHDEVDPDAAFIRLLHHHGLVTTVRRSCSCFQMGHRRRLNLLLCPIWKHEQG